MIEVRIRGLSEAKRSLFSVLYAYNRGYKRGLTRAAQFILEASRELVPYKTGYLSSTGYYEVSGDGFRAKAAVGYSAIYAGVQHENLSYYHPGGRSAKYIEIPVNRNRLKIANIIAQEMGVRW